MEGMDFSLCFANTAELDLQTFLCTSVREHVDIAPCAEVLDRGSYGWLVVLAGVGGAGLYLARSRSKEVSGRDQEDLRNNYTALKWIFEEEDENGECWEPLYQTFLKGFSFGILSPSSQKGKSSAMYHESGLNSLLEKPYNYKFLKQPINCKKISVKATTFPSKKLDNTEEMRKKRMPFNIRMKTAKDKMILQRVVASNRLSFKFYKPGADMRMEGDGCDDPEDFIETKHPSGKTDREGIESGISYAESNNLVDFLQNAEELKRFIRDTSFDSLASDLSLGINFEFDDEDDCDLNEFKDTLFPIETIEEENDEVFKSIHTVNNNQLWKLTDISYEAESSSHPIFSEELLTIPHRSSGANYRDDDGGSYVGSALDSWEWDEDCYYGDGEDTLASHDDNQFEQNTLHQSWLPDTCRELDLETELVEDQRDGELSFTPTFGTLPREGRASPLGCSYKESESLSRRSPSSILQEDITITCPTPDGEKSWY